MVKPLAHRGDPVSSWEAAKKLRISKVQLIRRLIVDEILWNGPMSAQELDRNIRYRLPNYTFRYSTIPSRVSELKQEGVLEPVGRKRVDGCEVPVDVLDLTPVMVRHFKEHGNDLVPSRR